MPAEAEGCSPTPEGEEECSVTAGLQTLLEDLAPFSFYRVSVAAFTSKGGSNPSAACLQTASAAPQGPPTLLQALPL